MCLGADGLLRMQSWLTVIHSSDIAVLICIVVFIASCQTNNLSYSSLHLRFVGFVVKRKMALTAEETKIFTYFVHDQDNSTNVIHTREAIDSKPMIIYRPEKPSHQYLKFRVTLTQECNAERKLVFGLEQQLAHLQNERKKTQIAWRQQSQQEQERLEAAIEENRQLRQAIEQHKKVVAELYQRTGFCGQNPRALVSTLVISLL